MSRWKVIALKSPANNYLWIAQGVTDDNALDRLTNARKVIKRYMDEARKENIWLMHRRKPQQHTWELVWQWRRTKNKKQE